MKNITSEELIVTLIIVNLLLMPFWVMTIVTAPKCDATKVQMICRNK